MYQERIIIFIVAIGYDCMILLLFNGDRTLEACHSDERGITGVDMFPRILMCKEQRTADIFHLFLEIASTNLVQVIPHCFFDFSICHRIAVSANTKDCVSAIAQNSYFIDSLYGR